MTDELKPSPEAVRIAEEVASSTSYKPDSTNYARVYQAAYRAATLVIDRTPRPAAVPGDVVEAGTFAVGKALKGDDFDPFAEPETFEFAGVLARAATTAMQPAIQAAVDAAKVALPIAESLERYARRNGSEFIVDVDKGVTARDALLNLRTVLATLRTVTEQGEGSTHD